MPKATRVTSYSTKKLVFINIMNKTPQTASNSNILDFLRLLLLGRKGVLVFYLISHKSGCKLKVKFLLKRVDFDIV